MKLIQWTLFIDMLGYREINGSINNEEKAKDFIKFMDTNKSIFEFTDSEKIKRTYKNKNFDLYNYYDIQKAFVSDSLIITYYPKEVDEPENQELINMHSANSLFIILMRLQTFIFNCFSEKSIFLRGGISNKYCYIKDSFAVGDGLIEAYVAESKHAIYPRIILSPEVSKNKELLQKIDYLSEKLYSGRSIIKKDHGEFYFLDYLGHALSVVDVSIPMIAAAASENPMRHAISIKSVHDYVSQHSSSIARKLDNLKQKRASLQQGSDEEKKVASVIEKFVWLKNYHNEKVNGTASFSKYVVH